MPVNLFQTGAFSVNTAAGDGKSLFWSLAIKLEYVSYYSVKILLLMQKQ
jgi:hypothetical protein